VLGHHASDAFGLSGAKAQRITEELIDWTDDKIREHLPRVLVRALSLSKWHYDKVRPLLQAQGVLAQPVKPRRDCAKQQQLVQPASVSSDQVQPAE